MEAKHKDFCDGNCDEGRECWRGTLMSPEEAARRGIKLMTDEEVEQFLRSIELPRP